MSVLQSPNNRKMTLEPTAETARVGMTAAMKRQHTIDKNKSYVDVYLQREEALKHRRLAQQMKQQSAVKDKAPQKKSGEIIVNPKLALD